MSGGIEGDSRLSVANAIRRDCRLSDRIQYYDIIPDSRGAGAQECDSKCGVVGSILTQGNGFFIIFISSLWLRGKA